MTKITFEPMYAEDGDELDNYAVRVNGVGGYGVVYSTEGGYNILLSGIDHYASDLDLMKEMLTPVYDKILQEVNHS